MSVFKGSSFSNKVVGKKDVQNETLPLMSVTVVRNIIDNLKSGEWNLYSIIANEYTDALDLDQLRVCIRWLDDDLHVPKDFTGISANLIYQQIQKSVLQDAIVSLQLSMDECRLQCYDGASNMLTKNSGVATKIQEKLLKAFPTYSIIPNSLSLRMKDSNKESKLI